MKAGRRFVNHSGSQSWVILRAVPFPATHLTNLCHTQETPSEAVEMPLEPQEAGKTLSAQGFVTARQSKLFGWRPLLLGARTLLGAPGLTTRSKDATSNKGHRY